MIYGIDNIHPGNEDMELDEEEKDANRFDEVDVGHASDLESCLC